MMASIRSFLNSEKNFNIFMAVVVLLVLVIPVGIANVGLGYLIGESPCTKCWFERIAMMYIGVMGVFIVRYGPRIRYLISIMFVTAYGLYTTIRQTSQFVTLDHGQGFGDAIMGAHTYTWGVFVFWFAVVSFCAILVFIRRENPVSQDVSGARKIVKPITNFSKWTFILALVVILSNAFQALLENGIPPFSGKGRPARFTLNVGKAAGDWTTVLWTRPAANWPWTLRGKENVEYPYVAGVNTDVVEKFSSNPAEGPLALDPSLKVELTGKYGIPFAPEGCLGTGTVTGIAWHEKQQKFGFVTNNAGIYYTDPKFEKVTDSAILDKPNGNDIRITVDAFVMDNYLVGLATNKTIWATELKDPSQIDSWWQWRIFREASPSMAPVWKVLRPWMVTARARLCFVASAAYDAENRALHMVTVPNQFNKNTIISSFDMTDRKVFQEKNLKPAKGAEIRNGKKVLDYYITGSVMVDGKLYAISKNYQSLLVIDPESVTVEKVAALPKMSEAHSLAAANGRLYTLGLEGGKNVIYELSLQQ